jgi:hypothetical protein
LIDLKTLIRELEAKRKQMIKVGMQLGLLHPETLKLSQEIDRLHNELIRMNCKESLASRCE